MRSRPTKRERSFRLRRLFLAEALDDPAPLLGLERPGELDQPPEVLKRPESFRSAFGAKKIMDTL